MAGFFQLSIHMIQAVLYVSKLRQGDEARSFSKLASQLRSENVQRDITGIMVFDGAHAVHYLEGPSSAFDRMSKAIEQNPCHQNITYLYQGEISERLFLSFRTGYWYHETPEKFETFKTMDGLESLEHFKEILPELDLI